MTKKLVTKKSKVVRIGSTPTTPNSPKNRKKLHKRMKERLEVRHKEYPEVRGKIVDSITHSIDDGTLCMNVCFKDKAIFSLRFACDLFIVGADISNWKTGNCDIIREYMRPILR